MCKRPRRGVDSAPLRYQEMWCIYHSIFAAIFPFVLTIILLQGYIYYRKILFFPHPRVGEFLFFPRISGEFFHIFGENWGKSGFLPLKMSNMRYFSTILLFRRGKSRFCGENIGKTDIFFCKNCWPPWAPLFEKFSPNLSKGFSQDPNKNLGANPYDIYKNIFFIYEIPDGWVPPCELDGSFFWVWGINLKAS